MADPKMLRTRESAGPKNFESVADFERMLGRPLPKAYRQFLLTTNGGRPERDLVVVPGCAASPYARIHFFFGIGHQIECYDLAWNLAQSGDIPTGFLAIATTEGADIFCLTPTGAIVFWDAYENIPYPVAECFERFLMMLYRDDLSPRFGSDVTPS